MARTKEEEETEKDDNKDPRSPSSSAVDRRRLPTGGGVKKGKPSALRFAFASDDDDYDRTDSNTNNDDHGSFSLPIPRKKSGNSCTQDHPSLAAIHQTKKRRRIVTAAAARSAPLQKTQKITTTQRQTTTTTNTTAKRRQRGDTAAASSKQQNRASSSSTQSAKSNRLSKATNQRRLTAGDDDASEEYEYDDDRLAAAPGAAICIPRSKTNEEMEQKVAFCCSVCHCHDTTTTTTAAAAAANRNTIPDDDPFVQSGENGLYHRRCCHGVYNVNDTSWKSPMEVATSQLFAIVLSAAAPAKKQKTNNNHNNRQQQPLDLPHPADPALWKRARIQAETEVLRLKAECKDVDPIEALRTHARYRENKAAFKALARRTRPAVVLDLFAGIGSSIVALKQLEVSIGRIIHVEHDMVATHVYRSNHEEGYLDESVVSQHFHFDTINDFENELESTLEKVGYVDIVLGAPPYYDSTDGIDGQSWKEALAISKLIRKLQKHQRDHHIFFSVETAVVRKGEYVSMDQGDVRKLEEAFEVSWSLELDAKFFSPVRRKSRFFSNIPVTSKQTDYCGRHNEDVAGCCILRGYQHGGNSPIARFPGIMPGKERIDDKRMLVFRQGQKETGIISKQRTLTTKEREIMMGFPNNYVSKHLKTLFTELMQKGYGTTFDFQHYWKLNLAKIYHRFGGGPHKFDSSGIYNKNDEPLVLLELRPRSAQEDEYLNEKQYAKHLIGNTSSIPVLSIVLRQLCKKFSHQNHDDYPTSFAWHESETENKNE